MLKTTKHLKDFIEEHASVVNTGGKKYYYLPYWFVENDGEFYGMHLNNLPQDLKSAIEDLKTGEIKKPNK